MVRRNRNKKKKKKSKSVRRAPPRMETTPSLTNVVEVAPPPDALFTCAICLDAVELPGVTQFGGRLYCWSCLYQLLEPTPGTAQLERPSWYPANSTESVSHQRNGGSESLSDTENLEESLSDTESPHSGSRPPDVVLSTFDSTNDFPLDMFMSLTSTSSSVATSHSPASPPYAGAAVGSNSAASSFMPAAVGATTPPFALEPPYTCTRTSSYPRVAAMPPPALPVDLETSPNRSSPIGMDVIVFHNTACLMERLSDDDESLPSMNRGLPNVNHSTIHDSTVRSNAIRANSATSNFHNPFSYGFNDLLLSSPLTPQPDAASVPHIPTKLGATTPSSTLETPRASTNAYHYPGVAMPPAHGLLLLRTMSTTSDDTFFANEFGNFASHDATSPLAQNEYPHTTLAGVDEAWRLRYSHGGGGRFQSSFAFGNSGVQDPEPRHFGGTPPRLGLFSYF